MRGTAGMRAQQLAASCVTMHASEITTRRTYPAVQLFCSHTLSLSKFGCKSRRCTVVQTWRIVSALHAHGHLCPRRSHGLFSEPHPHRRPELKPTRRPPRRAGTHPPPRVPPLSVFSTRSPPLSAVMSAIFNFQSLLIVVLLLICTCAYIRALYPALLDRNRTGYVG